MKNCILALPILLVMACANDNEATSKTIWYCSECCDSLGNKVEHLTLSKATCDENNANQINDNTWTWVSKVVRDCGKLPCPPDNP
jgi:hypothetical protein